MLIKLSNLKALNFWHKRENFNTLFRGGSTNKKEVDCEKETRLDSGVKLLMY